MHVKKLWNVSKRNCRYGARNYSTTIPINGRKITNPVNYMVNITHKNNTLRKAIASATVTVSSTSTIDAIKNRKVPQGDVFEFSRAAGLLAVKKTSDVIPDCH